jgi:hypothetical protein
VVCVSPVSGGRGQACRDVAAILKACAERVEPHLQSVAIAKRVRSNLEKSWEVRWRVSPRKLSERSFEVGVCIDERLHALVPWVWCRGGRSAEDEIVRDTRSWNEGSLE